MNGKRHGKGMYRWKSGEQYEGPWVFDKMNGKGNFYHANGKNVEAIFRDDAKVNLKVY